jgi:hypothetical protein
VLGAWRLKQLVRHLSPGSYSIMEFRQRIEITIAEKMLKFPLLGERVPNNWNVEFTREVNNSSDMKYISSTRSRRHRDPLYEGKNIHQFVHNFEAPRLFIDVDPFDKLRAGAAATTALRRAGDVSGHGPRLAVVVRAFWAIVGGQEVLRRKVSLRCAPKSVGRWCRVESQNQL